jgi:hypothetical protein
MRPLNQILEERRKRVCLGCFETSGVTNICKCTLRNRFVDRWVCIPCHQKECQEDFEAGTLTHSGIINYYECGCNECGCNECGCKRTLRSHEPEEFRILYNWCSGEITDGLADQEHILDSDDTEDEEEGEEEKTPAKLKAKGFLPYRLDILMDDEYE